MQITPEHLKLTREDVRKEDIYKNLTDEQADELIALVWVLSEGLYAQFAKEESSAADNVTQ